MKIGIRRKNAGGATLLELTLVLVILGILALTQLQSGMHALGWTQQKLASAGVIQTPPRSAPPAGWHSRTGGDGTGRAQLTLSEPKTAVAQAFRKAADWLEAPGAPQERGPVCVGEFCV